MLLKLLDSNLLNGPFSFVRSFWLAPRIESADQKDGTLGSERKRPCGQSMRAVHAIWSIYVGLSRG